MTTREMLDNTMDVLMDHSGSMQKSMLCKTCSQPVMYQDKKYFTTNCRDCAEYSSSDQYESTLTMDELAELCRPSKPRQPSPEEQAEEQTRQAREIAHIALDAVAEG